MGGLMFVLAIAVTAAALGWREIAAGDRGAVYVYLFALVFGVIGFLDDYMKVVHHENTA